MDRRSGGLRRNLTLELMVSGWHRWHGWHALSLRRACSSALRKASERATQTIPTQKSKLDKALAILLGLLLGLVSGCGARGDRNQPKKDSPAKPSADSSRTSERAAVEAIQLFDITGESGIEFVHQDGSFGKFCLPETMTGGLALFDYDGDALIDIYFCNGVPLDPSLSKNSDSDVSTAVPGGNALYRNLGGFKFKDVTFEAGLASPDFGLGVTVGDYDNDGFADFYTSNFGRNALYRNNGDGSFARIHMQSENAIDGERFAAGASFADFNRDGNLDLFVGNYVCLGPSHVAQQAQLTRTQYPGPQDFEPETNLLLQSLGDGLWSDQSAESNITQVRGTAMGTVTGDLDDDGDIDIYVANDELPNFMFRNDGQGKFEESAFSLGVAVDGLGAASGSMGVDASDLNNDGQTDLFVTTFENELVTLYQMTEHAIFQDMTIKSKVGDGTKPHVTWGCCIADFENDGDRDLYIASGHLDQRGGGRFYQVQDLLMKNLLRESNKFEFVNVAEKCGDMQAVKRCSRGSAVADLDNDGDLDVVVLNLREKPTLLENRSLRSNNHWLQINLIGTSTNRDANGTRIRLVAGDLQLVDEVRNGRGYQSYWGKRLHFGLGEKQIVRVEIQWFNGGLQVIENLPANQTLTIIQPKN